MKTIVVLGMHRSGTSAVAGMLMRLGAHVGDESDLLPPADDNPRGFFEHRELKAVNDVVLEEFGGTWREPPVLPNGWHESPALEAVRPRARKLLDELARTGDTVVLKDPRMCLTLPFWRTVVPIDHVVATVRAPSDVAGSLMVRNGFTSDAALRLWTRYVVDALTHVRPDVRVHYDELFSDPVGTAERLGPLVGVPSLGGALREAVAGFVDESLRHHDDVALPESPALTLATWLHGLIRTDPDRAHALGAAIGEVWRDPTAGSTLHGQSTVLEELAATSQDRDALRDELDAARLELAFHDARARRLRHDLKDARAQATARREAGLLREGSANAAQRVRERQLEHEVQRREKRLVELQSQRSQDRRELDRTRARLEATRRDLDRLRNRRVVRAALGVAGQARPLFRAVRRVRRRPAEASSQAGPATTPVPSTRPAADTASRQISPTGEHRPSDAPSILQLDWDRADEWHRTPRPPTRSQPDEVTIVLPVHGGAHVVAACLEALVAHTTAPARLCLIDDASPDEETRRLLADAARHPRVDLLVNERNLGFTASVNRGLAHASGDVVVLNSDTQVGPRWLERLQHAAYTAANVGSVTAVSDDAGAFSVPTPGQANPVPAHLDGTVAARLVAQTATAALPSGPTGNGFCWYVRRAMLDDVGLLDEQAFPRGYGEENDLSMRALRAGWQHLVEPGTFVRHLRGTSFGEERHDLMARGRLVLDERYPNYRPLVAAWMTSDAMTAARDRVAHVWQEPDLGPAGRPAVLYVLQAGRGGSPAAALDLARAIGERYSCLMLTCDSRVYRLHRVVDGEAHLIESHELAEPIAFSETHREDVWEVLESIMTRHAVELVHIRHMVKQTLDAPEVASALGIPYVLSLHDFYLVCPTINLLDENGRYCGGVCTSGAGPCPIAMQWIERDAGPLKHDGVHQWRRTVRPAIEKADAVVTTSRSARDVFETAFPDAGLERMHLIEHGRDLPAVQVASSTPGPDAPIRVLVPGNLDVHKGANLIAEMLDAPGGERLEFHFLGRVPERFAGLGVDHGTYDRSEFADRVREIAPHLIGVLSTCAETYCHTLSEAWVTDLPVVVTDIGALGERARAHGGALIVPHDAPAEACRRIIDLADDPAAYEALRHPDADAVRPASAMAADYDDLYRRVLDHRRTFREAAYDRTDADPPRGTRRVGLIALGDDLRAPGSVHVRTLRRLVHPVARERLVWRRVTTDEVIRGSAGVDVLLVQRTAVPPTEVGPFLRAVEEHSYGLVVEIDDYLWDEQHLPEGDADWRPHVRGLRTLMERADLVLVSTPYLAERASDLCRRVAVVPNDLDERLWLRPLETGPDPDSSDLDQFRVLYVGTRTHAADLALLDEAFDRLDADEPGRWQLTVVGGEPDRETTPPWYQRIDPPTSVRNYPAFVPWIRRLARSHDVGAAPLADSPFARAKSDLKWLEYTAMGVPTALSAVRPYQTSVTDGETGLLVRNTTDDWVEALCLMRDDVRLRGRLLRNARASLQQSRLLRHSIDHWVDLVLSASTRVPHDEQVPA